MYKEIIYMYICIIVCIIRDRNRRTKWMGKEITNTKDIVSFYTISCNNEYNDNINFRIYYNKKNDYKIFMISLWFILEDTYWFIYNSKYTLKKYKKNMLPWHRWYMGLPLGSWISIILCLLLYLKTKDNIYKYY